MSVMHGRFEDDTRTRLSSYAKALIAAFVGIALGLGATYVVTDRGFPFGSASSGPWTSWPKTGSSEADPYARAIIARKAEAPLGNGEGLSFFASTDDAERPLNGACDYIIEMRTPPARLWTMTVFTPKGTILASPAGRHAIASSTVVRSAGGTLEVVASPSARAGNWLATPKGVPFVLGLNLYDTATSPTQSALEAAALPSIKRGECL